VYNGGCSSVLTCLAERSQSPKYMPSWQSERFWRPVHVMSWPAKECVSPVEVQLSELLCHTQVLGVQSPGANIITRCAGTKSHTYDES
jgi:hypothetical protein